MSDPDRPYILFGLAVLGCTTMGRTAAQVAGLEAAVLGLPDCLITEWLPARDAALEYVSAFREAQKLPEKLVEMREALSLVYKQIPPVNMTHYDWQDRADIGG